ncbi:MAG: hypothetical protein AAGE52_21880 [Myxococcota bacterium]
MRVPARFDASSVLLWVGGAVLATVLTWWDAQGDAPNGAEAEPAEAWGTRVTCVTDEDGVHVTCSPSQYRLEPAAEPVSSSDDLVWMDVADVEAAYGLPPVEAPQSLR